MIQTIENELLQIKVSSFGAELQSIQHKNSQLEYLWQGDPTFWGRRSPVLFPIVGALKERYFTLDHKKYPMGQHGFARDQEFTLIESTDRTVAYELKSSP